MLELHVFLGGESTFVPSHASAARLHICAARGLERVGCSTYCNILKSDETIKI
jgi:hypothetical protein